MIAFSFQYNPITANHSGVLLGVFLGNWSSYFLATIVISEALTDAGSVPLASSVRDWEKIKKEEN